jgi:hypothetical protein
VRFLRDRTVTAAVVLAVIGTGVTTAYVAWDALFPGDPDIDCATYVFPTAKWRAARPGPTVDERAARQLARNVVRCRLLLGKTRRHVRALLGPRDEGYIDEDPRGDLEWSYDVGVRRDFLDGMTVSLFVLFKRGHVIYTEAPEREPGGDGEDINTGEPLPLHGPHSTDRSGAPGRPQITRP